MKSIGLTRHLACAYAALRELLALVGLAAIAAFLVLHLRGPVEKALPALPALVADPFASAQALAAAPALAAGPIEARAAGPIQARAANTPREREQQLVTEYIAKRYRVAEEAIAGFVATAYRAGELHRLDPLLILAVMAIESRYNPVAESTMGAKGLMQVIPRYHQEKLVDHGGDESLLDPEVNILVGAQILREYLRRFGDTETALQMYAGALDEPTAQYSAKVFAEKARLDVLRAKTRKKPQSA